jgi:hypothetical protein
VIDPLSDAAFSDLSDAEASDEDKKLRPRFYTDEIKDEAATAREGRPIYRSLEMCEIRIPGDQDNVMVGRVDRMNPDPRQRFPGAYAKFKRGDLHQVTGTPLRRWGQMEPSEARGYEDMGVITVEQLAGLSDATCQKMRGSLADRQRAQDFLEQMKGAAPVAAARAEAAALRAELATLREQFKELGGKVPDVSAPAVAVEAPAPKRRGRPPKVKPPEPQE